MTNNNTDFVDDGIKPIMVGHILIREVDTGKVLVKQRDNLTQQETLEKGDTPTCR